MTKAGDNKDSDSKDDLDMDEDTKRPKLWGPFYLIIGFAGLIFSGYSVFHSLDKLVPLYGTAMTGVLIGAISLLLIVYGYRVIRRDI